jgi:ABC-2 type transport system ATP-binding protein
MNTTIPVIQTEKLSKAYQTSGRETRALDSLTLQVQPGEIFGYLGPNGAGKTTTIRLLLDFIRPTSGTARVLGLDARANSVEIHQQIGFMPGELNLWKNRTALQVIQYLASVRGNVAAQLKEAQQLADRLQLDMSKKVRDYSTGNKRKLGLVLALMHKPSLLILDEPTSGLDPLMQQMFNQMMLEVKASGRTVFLSSHVLSEVQAICDRVGILRDGQLKTVERVENLMHAGFRKVTLSFREAVPSDWKPRLEGITGASDVVINGKNIKLRLVGDFDPVLRAVNNGYVQTIQVEEPSLEEVFLKFYGTEAVRNNGAAKLEAVK